MSTAQSLSGNYFIPNKFTLSNSIDFNIEDDTTKLLLKTDKLFEPDNIIFDPREYWTITFDEVRLDLKKPFKGTLVLFAFDIPLLFDFAIITKFHCDNESKIKGTIFMDKCFELAHLRKSTTSYVDLMFKLRVLEEETGELQVPEELEGRITIQLSFEKKHLFK